MPDITPPNAAKRTIATTQHGDTRSDDYAWMKDDKWQEVLRDPSVLDGDIRDHLLAENAYYEKTTAALAPLRDQLVKEMRGRIKEDDSSVPAPDGDFAYFVRYREGGEYPVYARQPRDGGAETILYDGEGEAGDAKFFDVGAVINSPNHRLIAYSVDRLGSEYYDIRIRDIETGKERSQTIASTDGDIVWAADSGSFYYIERDDNQRSKWVKHHILGQDPAQDRTVYEEADDGMFLSIGETQDAKYILVTSGNSNMSETQFVLAASPTEPLAMIAPRRADVQYDVDHHQGRFFILTNANDAVDFKLVTTPVETPAASHWQDWQSHEAGTYIAAFATYKEFIVRLERRDARPRLVISDYKGRAHEVAIDEQAFAFGFVGSAEYDTEIFRYTYASPTRPTQIIDYNMRTKTGELRKTKSVPSGHKPDLYVTERLTAIAEDGAQIPVMVLRLKQTPLDGSAPLMLYGYGSYGIYIEDDFSTNILSLVDRGMIYACAHVRGGSAKGRQWYLDGKLGSKMNSFTDFISCGEMLVAQKYTAAGKIISYGGSAGGLLVGAAVNLAPELFGGVLGAVPFVDVLNTISDESLPLTPPEWVEWGDPIRTKDGYDWIKSYSPYDNIPAGKHYPPIMATGGLADYRVTYWEPAKWIARLRDTATGGPFLLRMNMTAGHGGSAARFEAMEERAHLYAYALKLVGLDKTDPVSHQ